METLFEPFCGAGGMGKGFADYFQISHAVDILSEAVATYRANFPGVDVQVKDVCNISGVRGDFDGIAGVIGGPPCQRWSIINVKRNRASKPPPERELCQEFMRLVCEIRPRFFVLENVPYVPGEIKKACRQMGDKAGYTTYMNYVDASAFGAAQTRKRWILVGVKGTWHLPAACSSLKTVRDAFRDLGENWGIMRSNKKTLDRLRNVRTPEWVAISSGDFKNACRLCWDAPAPAIVNLKKVYMVHPDEDRNISLAEAAALQGFPADYAWVGNECRIAQMIANAMPVELARAIAESLRAKP